MPLLNRRPDIVVFDSAVPDDQVLRPENCRLVVEAMSASSVTADQLDKSAEYGAAGIEHYWRVEGHAEPEVPGTHPGGDRPGVRVGDCFHGG
ncbi:Uma2 family endonuclease [Amycolatopsis sp. CA-128772]|uniref:Uma2 family endonuclease n=1 Tax=Amycolatopsis sp. CA-128772 TaxID=2073159 RepID=UPI001E2DC204|nr:Uma2 family endonuclease [Amycolatopsis sp. CA-128772]